MEKLYLECQCDCAQHTIRFTFDPSDLTGEIYTEVQLNPYHPWYQRLWIALKYVFGHQSKFGAFDCTILHKEDYPKLRSLLDLSDQASVSNVHSQG
jgi:hypothetical protein